MEFHNNANLVTLEKSFDLLYKLKTPKYQEKHLFVGQLSYNGSNDIHDVT